MSTPRPVANGSGGSLGRAVRSASANAPCSKRVLAASPPLCLRQPCRPASGAAGRRAASERASSSEQQSAAGGQRQRPAARAHPAADDQPRPTAVVGGRRARCTALLAARWPLAAGCCCRVAGGWTMDGQGVRRLRRPSLCPAEHCSIAALASASALALQHQYCSSAALLSPLLPASPLPPPGAMRLAMATPGRLLRAHGVACGPLQARVPWA